MFILLYCSGHIYTNAGSAAPHLCQTYSPPLHPEDPGHLHPDGHFRLLGEDARPVSWPQDIRDGAGAGAVEIKPFWKAHCACLVECAKALRRMGSQRKNATTGAAQHSQDTGLIRNPRCFTWDYGGGDFSVPEYSFSCSFYCREILIQSHDYFSDLLISKYYTFVTVSG